MADTEGLLSEVADEVISCKKDAVLAAVEKAKKVMEPAEIIDKGLSAGMNQVGILFERGKLFLPHVMMAADAMTTGAKVLEAELPAGTQSKKLGVDKMDLVDEHVMRELREKLDIGVITSVPGAAKSIAAKMNIEKLLDIKINSCDLFRRQIA